MSMRSLIPIALAVVFMLCLGQASQPTVVDLTSSSVDLPTKIAVQICAGLLNRDANSNGVYTLMNQPWDSDWLNDLYHIDNPNKTSIDSFLSNCLNNNNNNNNIVKGYIRYNYTLQKEIAPNLITLAAVLNGILLEDDSPYINTNTPLLFDTIKMFNNFTSLDATKYIYYNYVNDTTTLAFMDPGYGNANKHPFKPSVTGTLNPGLIDYIIKNKLFNFYFVDACIPTTDEYKFMLYMTNPNNNPWNNPINVMGYNDAFPVSGDLFEAETDCNILHNMGQVASDGFNNLSFLSRYKEINQTNNNILIQNPSKDITFNHSKTYIAFTIGDGDNMSYLKSSRRQWMQDRVKNCLNNVNGNEYLSCFPLQWSISPHTTYLAPLIAEWYYNKSYVTQQDYFVLPPSGHLYSYPSEFDYDTTQLNFIDETENDCIKLSCNSSVTWEFVFHWFKAIKEYYPRYSTNNIVNGFFAVNVPFNVPVAEFFYPKFEFYKILGDNNNVVLFKPREWRGTNASTSGIPLSIENYLTVPQMADEINFYPESTVTHIYITSDGGGNLQMIYDLVPKLKEHVQVVSPTQLIQMALDADKYKRQLQQYV